MIAAVRAAVDAGAVAAFYEPVVRLSDGALAGFEAHLQLPDGQIMDIHDLETLAGDPALSASLGEAVLETLLTDFTSWRSCGCAPEFVVTNVSLSELQREDYADRLLGRLAAHRVEPDCLRLDIVESGLIGARADPSIATTLDALKRAGVLAGLDRFGGGSSSLADLARLPIAAIKMDAQFTRGVETPGSSQTVVRAVVAIGTTLEMRVVGTGITAAAEAESLNALGCMFGQGPYFGTPGDAAAAFARLGA
jgi:c-di-GMP-specific phosphodiesterase